MRNDRFTFPAFERWLSRVQDRLAQEIEANPGMFDGFTFRVYSNSSDDPNYSNYCVHVGDDSRIAVEKECPVTGSRLSMSGETLFGERYDGQVLAREILDPKKRGMQLYSDNRRFNNRARNRIVRELVDQTGLDVALFKE